jgi:hypothetical protein
MEITNFARGNIKDLFIQKYFTLQETDGARTKAGHKSMASSYARIGRMDSGRDLEHGIPEDDPGAGELHTTILGQ